MPIEYNSEEQAICAVGLVQPRPGVFAEAVQYLLVICTTTEVNFLFLSSSSAQVLRSVSSFEKQTFIEKLSALFCGHDCLHLLYSILVELEKSVTAEYILTR